jgi:outer membrane receptor protein involved in Fe transport
MGSVLGFASILVTAAWASDLDRQVEFRIPAQSLDAALVQFSDQAKLQITTSAEQIKGLAAEALIGKYKVADALTKLLRRSGLSFRAVGQSAISIGKFPDNDSQTPRSQQATAPGSSVAVTTGNSEVSMVPQEIGAEQQSELAEVVVSARKRSESIIDVPESISAFSSQTLSDFKIESFDDYASKVPNLSFAYGAGGFYGFSAARSVAIRGMVGPNMTGFYIDDTPLFDSMDPRIVDVERIEVLKGPQGTLYGSSSMGGNIRIISKKPSMDEDSFSGSAELGDTKYGSGNYEAEGIGNIVMVPDLAAVRLMAFYDQESPFITRTFPISGASGPGQPAGLGIATDVGGTETTGASASVLLTLNDSFDVTFRLLYQREDWGGWPAAFAPAPAFEVTSLTLNHPDNVQESASDEFTLPSLEMAYRGEGWNVASSTSYFERSTFDYEDGTRGVGQYLTQFYGYTPPSAVPIVSQETNDYARFAQETRIGFDETHGVSGTAGVFFSDYHTHQYTPPVIVQGLAQSGVWPTNNYLDYYTRASIREVAGFGELYYEFLRNFTLTLGARVYSLEQSSYELAHGLVFVGNPSQSELVSNPPAHREHGVIPKFALEYKITDDSSVYTTAAKGYRPGGANAVLPPTCDSDLRALGFNQQSAVQYKTDNVWSYELGTKMALIDRRLLLSAAAFQIKWSDVQQNLYLPDCGFLNTFNIGAAKNNGAELELTGHPVKPLELRAGLGYLDAKVTQGVPGGLPDGSRLLQVPRVTASLGLRYEWTMEKYTPFVTADYSYTDDSLSENTSTVAPLERPSYSLVNARAGVHWGKSELSLYGDNLTNTKANLGDLVFNLYHEDVTLPNGQTVLNPRVVVERPLTFGVQYRYGF